MGYNLSDSVELCGCPLWSPPAAEARRYASREVCVGKIGPRAMTLGPVLARIRIAAPKSVEGGVGAIVARRLVRTPTRNGCTASCHLKTICSQWLTPALTWCPAQASSDLRHAVKLSESRASDLRFGVGPLPEGCVVTVGRPVVIMDSEPNPSPRAVVNSGSVRPRLRPARSP